MGVGVWVVRRTGTAVMVLCLYVGSGTEYTEFPGISESPGPSDGHGGGGYLSHLVRRTGAVVAWWVVVTWSVEWERRWWDGICMYLCGGGGGGHGGGGFMFVCGVPWTI